MALQLQGVFTPPPSDPSSSYGSRPGAKRKRIDSSESSRSTEDNDIADRLGFTEERRRVGCPPLFQLPLERSLLRSEQSTPLSSLEPTYERILRDNYIAFSEIHYVQSMIEGLDFTDATISAEVAPTILIIADGRSNTFRRWLHAVTAIKQHLAELGAHDRIHVEIIDPALEQELYMDVIEHGHWANHFYNSNLRQRVLNLISTTSRLQYLWQTIDLVRLGPSSEPHLNPITISIICSMAAEEADWIFVEDEITRILHSFDLPEPIEVNFGLGEIELAAFPLDDRKVKKEHAHERFQIPYSSVVNMGSDFGHGKEFLLPSEPLSEGETSRGTANTMGGWVRVTFKNNTTQILGLTNYHCMRAGISGFTLSPVGAEEPPQPGHGLYSSDMDGFTRHDSERLKLTSLESPSRRRHRITVKIDQDYLDRFSDPQKEQFHAERIQFFDRNRQKFAKPFMGSGYKRRTETNGRLDWALLEPFDSKRIGRNLVPYHTQWPSGMLECLPRCAANHDFVLKGIVSPGAIHERIFMIGGMTGPIGAEFSETRSDISMRHDDSLDMEKSREHLYIPNTSETGKENGFGRRGDSGSFVFTDSGEWAGLFFGGGKRAHVAKRHGYFQDATEVINDIIAFSKSTPDEIVAIELI